MNVKTWHQRHHIMPPKPTPSCPIPSCRRRPASTTFLPPRRHVVATGPSPHQGILRQHDRKHGHGGNCNDVKAAAFAYARAASAAEAIQMLAADPDARLLAGGQSLEYLNLRLARPAALIDIKRATELRLLQADAQHLRLGACWTHAEIEDGTIEDPTQGLLTHVARGIAYRAVRKRGTVGGSLAHADPAADWLTTMAVLGATIIVQGTGGARSCPAAAFVRGPFATALGPAELIVAIEVPRLSPAARWGYHKVCRKTGEFARAIGAAVLDERHGLARVVTGATGGRRSTCHARPRAWRKREQRRPRRWSPTNWRQRAAPRHGRCTPLRYAAHWRSWRTRHRPQRGQARGSQNPLRTRVMVNSGHSMTPVSLTVNGRAVQALVEPRTHLADFLREHLHLTGTHLGCEQGVCGACTVVLDGKPQRSCIAYALDCDGSTVTTIEGFDDDALMENLRTAFSAHHGLQCGFCTPGMLVTARDIVARLGDVPEARIREELSGNLCRCGLCGDRRGDPCSARRAPETDRGGGPRRRLRAAEPAIVNDWACIGCVRAARTVSGAPVLDAPVSAIPMSTAPLSGVSLSGVPLSGVHAPSATPLVCRCRAHPRLPRPRLVCAATSQPPRRPADLTPTPPAT